MNNQTKEEQCCFCGSVDLTFKPDMDIICKSCGKVQPDCIEKGTATNNSLKSVEDTP